MKKTASTVCLLVLLALTCLAVSAQIRIPRIPRTRPNQPAQPQPTSPTQPSQPPATSTSVEGTRESVGRTEAVSQPGGNYVDDGFTWFEAMTSHVLDEKHMEVPTGWALKSSVRVMGIYPAHTAFKIVVSKAGAPVATTRCEAGSYNMTTRNPADVSFIYIDGCWDSKNATKELGKFDVDVVVINGGTNAEASVRKYKIEVLKVDRVNAQVGKLSVPESPRYMISRHAEAPVSILFLRPARAFGYVLSGEARRTSDLNQMEILFSLSPSEKGKTLGVFNVRCSVDGKHIDLGGGNQGDVLPPQPVRRYEEIYTDRIAPAYKAGPVYKDDIGFSLVRAPLPFEWKNSGHGFSMSEHPGNWECSMMDNGEKFRTWRWTVGSAGTLVKHAEQNGNVNLYFNSYLIDMDIPAGGSILDKRLVSTSATDGFFYGQKWTTPEGRAMAARVPTKGSPTPVPSNKIK